MLLVISGGQGIRLDNPGTIKEKGSQPVERKEAVLDFSIIEKSKADLIKGMVGKLRNVGAATDAPAKSPVCFTSRDRMAKCFAIDMPCHPTV